MECVILFIDMTDQNKVQEELQNMGMDIDKLKEQARAMNALPKSARTLTHVGQRVSAGDVDLILNTEPRTGETEQPGDYAAGTPDYYRVKSRELLRGK